MPDLVMFGTRQIAEVLAYYFEHDSDYRIAAFTVDGEYLTETSFLGRPVVPFEEVGAHYPPASHAMFVALSYAKRNAVRVEKFAACKAAGYRLASHISPRAHAWDGLTLGENSFVMENNVVQPFAQIGANTTIWAGNHIGHHSTVGDHCFLASHIVVSGGVSIGERCFIGVNATLRDGITVAPGCVIGAGALILGNTEPDQVFIGPRTEASKVPASRLRL